jgi:hypothetical protein
MTYSPEGIFVCAIALAQKKQSSSGRRRFIGFSGSTIYAEGWTGASGVTKRMENLEPPTFQRRTIREVLEKFDVRCSAFDVFLFRKYRRLGSPAP